MSSNISRECVTVWGAKMIYLWFSVTPSTCLMRTSMCQGHTETFTATSEAGDRDTRKHRAAVVTGGDMHIGLLLKS